MKKLSRDSIETRNNCTNYLYIIKQFYNFIEIVEDSKYV